jgi:phenylacetate-CoA ligase
MSLPFKLLYYGLQSLRKEPVWQAFNDLMKTDFASLDELHHIQLTRAKEYLSHALNTTPYYKHYDQKYVKELASVIHHDQLVKLFVTLPRLEKRDVKIHNPEFYSDKIESIKYTMDTTSGSSGTPLMFPCDNLSWAYRHASIFRCFSWYGISVGDRYGYFFGQHWAKLNRLKVQLKDSVFNRIRVSAFDLNLETTPALYEKLKAFKPKYLYGYPSSIYSFFRYCHELNIPARQLNLVAVFTTAEPLLDDQRSFIENNFGVRCVNMYGSAEGSNTAFECPAGNLHETIDMTLNVYDEVGENQSKIYVNDLFLNAFPLVNYSLDDYVERSSRVCDCGRKHPILKTIKGRSGEPILLPDGRSVNANLPSYVFKNVASGSKILKYRFYNVQNRKLVLLYEVMSELIPEDLNKIKEECTSAFGSNIVIELYRVNTMPNLPNAKHKDYVYSEIEISSIVQ